MVIELLCLAPLFIGQVEQSSRVNFSDFQACGPCCLYMACVAKGLDVDFDKVMASFVLGPNGETSLWDLDRVSGSCGLVPVMARVGPDFAEKLPTPFIAHIKLEGREVDHFVLVMFASSKHVIYVDPPGIGTLESMEKFKQRWSGNVLAFANSDLEAQSLRAALHWTFWSHLLEAGLAGTFAATLAITALFAWSHAKARRKEPFR